MKNFILVLFFSLIYNFSNACVATFSHSYACAGDTMFFNAVDQFAIYTWDFGDSLSGVTNISHDTDSYHVFTVPGTYYVTLFVNIGGSWDYESQIINISADCFNAQFSWNCMGNYRMDFI